MECINEIESVCFYYILMDGHILMRVYIIFAFRYKERAKELSKLYKDAPYDALQNAIQWIEYVMRHNGTIGLQDRIFDQPWYQRYDWDIIGFLAVVAFITFLISLYVLFQILCFICKSYQILCSNSRYYIKSKSQ